MKKSNVIAITLAVLVAICATVIVMRYELTKAIVPHEQYIAHGRYYDGIIVTDDENEWLYTTEIISDQEAYDAEPVYVVFDDNGTGKNIKDDIVLGVVKDINTATYDSLEIELSNAFELEREGNNIHLTAHK